MLTDLRQALIDRLTDAGIHAIGAWDREPRLLHPKGVAAVSLRSLRLGPVSYLGERTDDNGSSVPLYGQPLTLSFGLDLYAPKGQPDLCLRLFDRIAQAAALGLSGNLTVTGLSCGSIDYQRDPGLLTCEANLDCKTWCLSSTDEEGAPVILDFIVKGDPKQ